MHLITATSLVVLPTLAHNLASHTIQAVPIATLSLPNEEIEYPADDISPPLDFQQPEPGPHDPSSNILLINITSIPPSNKKKNKETYARPTLKWLTHLPRPRLGTVPYGKVINKCKKPNTIALTFDDGPWKYTADLLDLLDGAGARATFFVCGGNMGGGGDGDGESGQITGNHHPRLLRHMVDGGHQVGTHTWGHADLDTLDGEGVLEQMLRNEQAIVEALGMVPTYFRPPYFNAGEEVLDTMEVSSGSGSGLGYHVVNAGVDTLDWVGDYDAARENFDEGVGEGGRKGKIVLAHDIHEKTVYELAEYMIRQAEEKGYRLVTVGECLGDPVQNWYRNPSTGESWLARESHGPGRDGRGGHGSHGRGRGRDLTERAVVPPPDAPKENDESWEFELAPVSSHRLHVHTLPPPGLTEQQNLLSVRSMALSNGTHVRRTGTEALEGTTEAPRAIMSPLQRAEHHQSTSNSPTIATATATVTAAFGSVRPVIVEELCERLDDGCTPIYMTGSSWPVHAALSTTPTPDPVSTTSSNGMRSEHHSKKLSDVVERAMTTMTVPFPFQGGQLPPKGFKIAPTIIEETEGEDEEGKMEVMKKPYVVPYPHIVEDLTEGPSHMGYWPRNGFSIYRGQYGGRVRRKEGESEGQGQGQGQGQNEEQNHNEHHQQEVENQHEQAQEQENAAANATATVQQPVTAGGLHVSSVSWGLVLALVTLHYLFR